MRICINISESKYSNCDCPTVAEENERLLDENKKLRKSVKDIKQKIELLNDYFPKQALSSAVISNMLKWFDAASLKEALRQNDASRETVVFMSPDNFLKLAEPGYEKRKEDEIEESLNKGEKIREIPFLGVNTDKDDNVYVQNNGQYHEGRHRVRAVAKRGLRLVPVRIKSGEYGDGNSFRWGQTTRRPKYIFGYGNSAIVFPPIQTYDTDGKFIGNQV